MIFIIDSIHLLLFDIDIIVIIDAIFYIIDITYVIDMVP